MLNLLKNRSEQDGKEKKSEFGVQCIKDFLQTEYDMGFLDMQVDAVWDTTVNRKNQDQYSYYVKDFGNGNISEVKMQRIGDFMTQFAKIGILLDSGMCSTKFFPLRSGEDIGSVLRPNIPYDIDTCEYAIVKNYQRGEYVYASVTSFPDNVFDFIEKTLSLFRHNGGAIVKVYDRLLPLTQFIASRVEVKEDTTIFCLEQRNDTLLAWNSVRIDDLLVPINSTSFRIPIVNALKEIQQNFIFISNELVRQYKFAAPAQAVFITDDSPMTIGLTQADLQAAIAKASKLENIQIFNTPVASLEGCFEMESR